MKATGSDQRFAHGYLLDQGEGFALVDAKPITTRLGIVPISVDVEVTDQRGRRYMLRGVPLAGAPWRAYSTAVCWCALMRWELNGQVGYGSFQDNHSLSVESGLRGRRWTDRVPALTA